MARTRENGGADAPESDTPGTVPAPPMPASARESPRPVADRYVSGVLLKHGAAPYRFQPNGEPSYFLALETARGARTLWGRGLERALMKSQTQPQVGEAIGVRQNGIDPMTVITRERDDRGHVRLLSRHEAPRPHWIVERRSFFDERAIAAKAMRDPRVSRHEAVRDHPELEGAYWALDSASKIASERIADRPSRQRFLLLVRESLALATERGEALPAIPSDQRRTTAREASTLALDPVAR